MKQIEITVRLKEKISDSIKKLEAEGDKIIRESDINDLYLTSKLDELNKDNIQYILKKLVLLRSLKINNNEIKKITYKNKKFDSERKCNI